MRYGVAPGGGGAWRARSAHVDLALGLIALAALWLTPVLNPQSISAISQITRFKASGFNPETLDLQALDRLAEAGKADRADLADLVKKSGQTLLATAFTQGTSVQNVPEAVALRNCLAKIMPLQPKTPGGKVNIAQRSFAKSFSVNAATV